ncbi:WG repeat-containing protein [uncultured Butyricimonas sp.]|uniref:WG repeat-containing protein n=1 Tax=uncultured Butyricimonas sp. TaxID=1268785 RepID=UPI0025967B78|nr:WG repeat-containing protein [uncultured Butyricimonas sp.]
MKRILLTCLDDVRISIMLLFMIFYLFNTIPFDPNAIYWLNFKPVIKFGDFELGQLYINGRSFYLGLGIWLIPSFIYQLYKKKWKNVGILLVAFCIPMFIHGTSISCDLVDYKMNIEKYLEPRTKKDKLGWLLLDRDKQVISGIYSLCPIRFNHNRAIVKINNNWTTSISGNDVMIIPDTNRYTYKGVSYIYIDTLGKLVSPKVFSSVSQFNNYGIAVCKDSFYGIIDTSGREILPFEYDEITANPDDVKNYHWLEKNMQYGLFCDSTLSILLNDCSEMYFWNRTMDSCFFTKNGKDSLLILSTRIKIPWIQEKRNIFYIGDYNVLDLALSSLKENANIIREIITNQQDSLPQFQIISDYLYYDHWGDSYMNTSNHWRDQFLQDSNNFLSVDFQIENKLYNEWWKFHEYTFSTIHKLQNSETYYNTIEELNLQKILRLVYSYLLLFNEETNLDVTSTINKQVEFSSWNDSIITCYNDLVQVQGLSPMAIRHINNERHKWKQLIEYRFNILNNINKGGYMLKLKRLLNNETMDLLLLQMEHMRQFYLDVANYMSEYQNNSRSTVIDSWLQLPMPNIEIKDTLMNR